MTTTPVPVILGPCAPLSNLRSSDRSWWDHTTRGRRHRRPTLFPGGGPHDDIPPTHSMLFPLPEDGCIAMRLLSSARHKWPSKDDGRETLVDAAGAPPGFPLVPTP